MYIKQLLTVLVVLLGSIQFSLAYVGNPNHREIAVRGLQLAVAAGFVDTSLTIQEIQNRIEAGAYSEDYEQIPGVAGSHYPNPWDQGPTFNFLGLIPTSRIPYGSPVDVNRNSGWYRGLPHGYEPVQGFLWPGAETTTVAWANHAENIYTWDTALQLYRQGNKAQAYQCLGHILHLLADLSVPAHVKVVNHGATNIRRRSGNPLRPDLVDIIVDEYETALSGGLVLSGNTIIPDLLPQFLQALGAAQVSNIPRLQEWFQYLEAIALYTYSQSHVQLYYEHPTVNGQFGVYKNGSGQSVNPQYYGGAPIGLVDGRVTQFFPMTTAQFPGGTIVPESVLVLLCYDLVSKAVEYSAGLILLFLQEANQMTDVHEADLHPRESVLFQNYPNPFNPVTSITFDVPRESHVSIKVYDILGQEVATLVNDQKKPGRYVLRWDARSFASGVYFYRMKADEFVATKKLIILK